MIGTIHGGEHLGFESRIAEWLLSAHLPVDDPDSRDVGMLAFLDAGGVLLAFPYANPDGYAYQGRDAASAKRYNANGVDLNRDYDELLEPETSGLVSAIEAELTRRSCSNGVGTADLSVHLAVDYHVGLELLLVPYGDARTELTPLERDLHELVADSYREATENAYPTRTMLDWAIAFYVGDPDLGLDGFSECADARDCDAGDYCTHHELLGDSGRCTPIEDPPIEQLGASADYFHSRFGATSVILEASFSSALDNEPDHRNWWDAMLQRLAAGAARSCSTCAPAPTDARCQCDLNCASRDDCCWNVHEVCR